MPSVEPINEGESIKQQPERPEASGREVGDDELKTVSGGLTFDTGISGATDSCISRL